VVRNQAGVINMKKLISILLNFPYLVNQLDSIDKIKQRIKLLPNSKILFDLFDTLADITDFKSTSFTGRDTKSSILERYQFSPLTKKWLISCDIKDKSLNRKNAKKKFLSALSEAENTKIIDEFINANEDFDKEFEADEDFVKEFEAEQKEWELKYGFYKETEEIKKLNVDNEDSISHNTKTLEQERDSLLAQNESLKERLDSEYETRSRDFIDKDRVKSGRNSFLVIAGFMVLLAFAYISVDEFKCVGSFGSQCVAV